MASSSEAFEKLEMWKNSNTPLKVTVIERGKTKDVGFGRIGSLDAKAGLVAVAVEAIRAFATFNIEDSKFSVEPSRVVATRNESDWITFELV